MRRYVRMPIASFAEFETTSITTENTTIFVRRAGSGPPVLLLHGFPETHLMWRHVAPLLARRFTAICADLPGYGQSSCPPSTADHTPYSKRSMAKVMADVMTQLGFARFSVAGHDRGARIAYRLALDHPDRIERAVVLDVVTIADAWEHADKNLATGFWPWALLSQPEPLPEHLISAAPEAVIDDALSQWGTPPQAFGTDVRAAYVAMLRDSTRVHAICEEFRAAATIDHEHDRENRRTGRRIECPLLALWGQGALNSWYAKDGGPLALWRAWANDVRGHAVNGGHFFPEEIPEQTAEELARFFAG